MQDYYNEYLRDRMPSAFAMPAIRWFHRRMLHWAAPSFPPVPQILEVGFGYGLFAEEVRLSRYGYQALDASPEVCELAAAKGFHATLGCFPAQSGDFDCNVVWMSHVLEHARDWHEARAMLVKAHRLLPAEGVLVVICPDVESWGHHFWLDWSHGYPVSKPRLAQLMSEAGFDLAGIASHTATVRAPWARFLLDLAFRLVPVALLDAISRSIAGKDYATSFMTVFGWRQIMAIGRKRETGIRDPAAASGAGLSS